MLVVQYALRALFAVLGAAAIAISCRMNYAALSAIGGPNAQYIAAVAVMTAAVKAGVPVYADYFRAGRRPLYIVFAIAVAFDILCVLGFAAMTRGAALDTATGKGRTVAELQAAVTAVETEASVLDADLQAAMQRARVELDRLNEVSRASKYLGRAAEVIRPAIEAQRARAGDCSGRGHVDACQGLQRLLSEESDAVAREAAARRVDEAGDKLAAARREAAPKLAAARAKLSAAERPAGIVDPAAYAMREVAALAGFSLPEEWAGKVFNGVLVLLIELLAVIGLKAAFHPEEHDTAPAAVTPRDTPAPTVTPRKEVYSPLKAETPLEPFTAPTPPPGVPPQLMQQPAIYLPASPTGDAIMDWLRQQGGSAVTSYRKLAAAVGVSVATASSAAKGLQAQGLISIATVAGGTSLKIIPRQNSQLNVLSPAIGTPVAP